MLLPRTPPRETKKSSTVHRRPGSGHSNPKSPSPSSTKNAPDSASSLERVSDEDEGNDKENLQLPSDSNLNILSKKCDIDPSSLSPKSESQTFNKPNEVKFTEDPSALVDQYANLLSNLVHSLNSSLSNPTTTLPDSSSSTLTATSPSLNNSRYPPSVESTSSSASPPAATTKAGFFQTICSVIQNIKKVKETERRIYNLERSCTDGWTEEIQEVAAAEQHVTSELDTARERNRTLREHDGDVKRLEEGNRELMALCEEIERQTDAAAEELEIVTRKRRELKKADELLTTNLPVAEGYRCRIQTLQQISKIIWNSWVVNDSDGSVEAEGYFDKDIDKDVFDIGLAEPCNSDYRAVNNVDWIWERIEEYNREEQNRKKP